MNLIIVAREKLQPIYLQVFPMTNFEKPSILVPKTILLQNKRTIENLHFLVFPRNL